MCKKKEHKLNSHMIAFVSAITKDTFSSWAEENASEVQYIIDSNTSKSRFIVMGDLNNGPAIPDKNIAAHFEGTSECFIG